MDFHPWLGMEKPHASRLRRACALLITVAIVFPPNIRAEGDADVLQFFEEEAQVITASKKSERASDAPATVYVVTKRDIRLRGYSNLKDVLRDLPGMETIEHYFSEMGTLVPVRGVVGNNKIVVLVNGMRVNPPGGEDMMLRSDFSVRQAEQIEVIYGPGSTLYGQDAISAVINVITRKPREGNDGEVGAVVGSHQSREGWLALSRKVNETHLHGYVQQTDANLTDLANDYPHWWKLYDNKGLSTQKRFDKGLNAFSKVGTDTHGVQVWYRESSRSSSEGAYTPILLYVDGAVWHDKSLVAEAKNKTPLGDRSDLESSITYNKYEINPDSRYIYPISPTAVEFRSFKYGVGTGVTLEEKLSYTPTDTLSFIGGGVVSDYDIIPKASVFGGADRSKDITSQGQDLSYYTRLGDPSSLVTVKGAQNIGYRTYGAYLESHWQTVKRLNLVAGLRVDKNSRFKQRPISPRAAAVVKISDSLTAKYVFTKAFVAPAPYFGYNVFDNGVAINTTNEKLQPEKSISNEVNLVYQRDKLNLGASAYMNRAKNLLVFGDRGLPLNTVMDEIYLDLAGTDTRRLTQSANGGTSESKGFELSAKWGGDRLSGWASYSIVNVQSRIGASKTGLDQISRHNARLGATWSPTAALHITPSVVYRSTPENYGNATLNLGSAIRNPYEVNIHAVYAPTPRVDLFAGARNLTNNRYALKGVLGPMPQETLSLYGGLKVSLF